MTPHHLKVLLGKPGGCCFSEKISIDHAVFPGPLSPAIGTAGPLGSAVKHFLSRISGFRCRRVGQAAAKLHRPTVGSVHTWWAGARWSHPGLLKIWYLSHFPRLDESLLLLRRTDLDLSEVSSRLNKNWSCLPE